MGRNCGNEKGKLEDEIKKCEVFSVFLYIG
jgi:hypothetical protein